MKKAFNVAFVNCKTPVGTKLDGNFQKCLSNVVTDGQLFVCNCHITVINSSCLRLFMSWTEKRKTDHSN